jgi:hypothetical protein
LNFHQFAQQTINNLPIRHKTLTTYRSMYCCHIEAALKDLELSEIKRHQIQELITPLPPQTGGTDPR